MLQSSQTNAEGGSIGQKVAADDLHQNAEAEACVEDGTQSVQDLHVDLDEFIQAFLHDLNLFSGFTAASGQRCDSVVDLLLAVGQDGQHAVDHCLGERIGIDLDELHALLLQLVVVLFLIVQEQLVLVCLALGTGLIHNGLLAVGQTIVLGQTHCDVDPCTQVSGQDQVGADLVEALGLDHGQRVLLSLDGALLHGGQRFGPGHRTGGCG